MSKKRLNYDSDHFNWLMDAMNFNPTQMKYGSYLNDYQKSLDAMRVNAMNATNLGIRRGKSFSPVDAMKAQLEYASTLEERAYNEYLYNQYESPASMVRQYDEAGLNPMMLAGGSSVGGSVNATSSNSMSLGRGTDSARGLDIMGMILNAVMGAAGQVANFKNSESQRISANAAADKAASDVAVNDAEINKKNAEANLIKKQEAALDIDIEWKGKMYDINYKVLEDTHNLKDLEYKYEEIFGWRARKLELDKLAAEIDVNEAEFEKLTAEAWRIRQLTPAEKNQINAMVDKINADKAVVDLEKEAQDLENQDTALGLFAHQVCTEYGIDPTQTDLVAQGMYLVVQKQNEAISDEEFAKKMTVLALASKKRGKWKVVKSGIDAGSEAVGTAAGTAIGTAALIKGGGKPKGLAPKAPAPAKK